MCACVCVYIYICVCLSRRCIHRGRVTEGEERGGRAQKRREEKRGSGRVWDCVHSFVRDTGISRRARQTRHTRGQEKRYGGGRAAEGASTAPCGELCGRGRVRDAAVAEFDKDRGSQGGGNECPAQAGAEEGGAEQCLLFRRHPVATTGS